MKVNEGKKLDKYIDIEKIDIDIEKIVEHGDTYRSCSPWNSPQGLVWFLCLMTYQPL